MEATVLNSLDGHRLSFSRYELKYLLRPELAERVVDFLRPYLEVDKYCNGNDANAYSERKRRTSSAYFERKQETSFAYTVRSIYFDSPDFECFHAKRGGQKYREKFRIRTYNHSGSAPLFLENKRKNGLSYVKDKVSLKGDALKAIRNLDYDSLREVDILEDKRRILDRLFFHIYRKAYFPVVLIAYEREAYVYSGQETIRVTLDRNLRARMFPNLHQIYDEDGLENLLHDWIILEVKLTDVVPRWMRRLSTLFQLRRQACSKYCTCVAHFLGEIPSIKESLAYVWTI